MADFVIVWDDEDDPDGNTQHIARHGLSPEEVEQVLRNPAQPDDSEPEQRSADDIWLDQDGEVHRRELGLGSARPADRLSRHRLPGPTAPEETTMSKPVPTKVELTPEQRDAFRSIRERAETDRPGPDELVERGDVEEFVSHGAFMELLGLVDVLRHEKGNRRGLSLTEVAERRG